jgi:hypothetical protein
MAEKKSGPRGISEERVMEATGKGWEEWFALLDRWAADRGGYKHQDAAKYLHTVPFTGQRAKLSRKSATTPERNREWWAQVIAIRYEWERGMRSEPLSRGAEG